MLVDKPKKGWVVCGCYLIVGKVVYGLEWGCIFVVVVVVAVILLLPVTCYLLCSIKIQM